MESRGQGKKTKSKESKSIKRGSDKYKDRQIRSNILKKKTKTREQIKYKLKSREKFLKLKKIYNCIFKECISETTD